MMLQNGIRRLATAAVVGVATAVLVPGLVLGHAELEEPTPADKSTVTVPVTEVSGLYSEGMKPDGSSLVVKDASGTEVWRWSSARMFTQGLQNRLVKAKEAVVFSEEWTPKNMHGKFTATAVLASDNHPIEETVEFELK